MLDELGDEVKGRAVASPVEQLGEPGRRQLAQHRQLESEAAHELGGGRVVGQRQRLQRGSSAVVKSSLEQRTQASLAGNLAEPRDRHRGVKEASAALYLTTQLRAGNQVALG